MAHASIVHSLLPYLFPTNISERQCSVQSNPRPGTECIERYVLRSVIRTVKTCMLHLDLALNVFECYVLRSVTRTVKICMLHFTCHKQKTTED